MKKAAEKKRKTRNFSVSTIVEMLFSLLMIPLGLAAVQALSAPSDLDSAEKVIQILAFLMLAEFVMLSVTTFLRALARRYRNQIPERRRLDFIFSGLFLACAAAIFIEPTLLVMSIAGGVFWASLLPDRVLAILRNRKWINIVLNVAFILLVLFAVWDVWAGAESQVLFLVVVMLLIALRSLARIMSVTFARLRLDLLRDIVQQTYAAEIIFGLLLLIASFSFVLVYTDQAFEGRYSNALWYCFAVVTTIGFGDLTATSSIGRILSVVLGVYGIIVVALITSIIVNFYGEMKKTSIAEADPAPEAGQEAEGEPRPETENNP